MLKSTILSYEADTEQIWQLLFSYDILFIFVGHINRKLS